MNLHEVIANEIKGAQEFLERSTRVLKEEHSSFTPSEGIYTAAQQLAHVATMIDWFVDGIVSPDGFSMDFEAHETETLAITSLTFARAKVAAAFANANATLAARSIAELEESFPPDCLIQGPKWTAVFGLVEHTAHHRGALTIYSRLLGLSPKMPYMET